MDNDWKSHHWETDGKPDGGQSFGVGFAIAWQRGSIQEHGRNGAYLIEVLEACLDELVHKDSLFPCAENSDAIAHLNQCLDSLRSRIKRREDQGIWGTHEPDPDKPDNLQKTKTNFNVYRIRDNQQLETFHSRKDAVFFCKVNQSLPIPIYEWEDEFDIREESVKLQNEKGEVVEERAIELLLEAEQELNNVQFKGANRNRAIAITHLQTAILWLHKSDLDSLLESRQPASDLQNAKGCATDG